jgi:glycosyltransferase involved in cell wall biosynthesis
MKKIVFIGIRGIPVVYSGFESFVEDLTNNLTGFSFCVYCRKRYVQKKYHNHVRLIYTPTIYIYKLETFIHSLVSSLHTVLFVRPDYVFFLGVGNAPFLFIPFCFGIKTIINVDGMDWEREKWGPFGRLYLFLCAYISTLLAHVVVTDSLYSYTYYKNKFKKETKYIPYMSHGYEWKEKKNLLKEYGVTKQQYYVWAGRFVPDNHLDDLLEAFISSKNERKLVIIGDDHYKTVYLKNLKKIIKKDVRIVATGFLSRDRYLTLIKNSYAYIETKQSGGTHPTLVDALTYAPLIICNDFPANKKIVGNGGYFYKNRDISSLKKILESKGKKAKKINVIVKIQFAVQRIANDYKAIFAS